MNSAACDYVKSLLLAAPDSAEHAIGQRIFELADREEILEYLTELMTDHAKNSRVYEIAWEVRLLEADVHAEWIPGISREALAK